MFFYSRHMMNIAVGVVLLQAWMMMGKQHQPTWQTVR
jgi:hypothetical protein